MDNILRISKELKLCKSTAMKYLKQGKILGWCNYDAKEEIEKANKIRSERISIKVICLNTEEIFRSQKLAAEKYNTSVTSIRENCKGNRKFSGTLLNGIKANWMYYEKYLELQNVQQLNNNITA